MEKTVQQPLIFKSFMVSAILMLGMLFIPHNAQALTLPEPNIGTPNVQNQQVAWGYGYGYNRGWGNTRVIIRGNNWGPGYYRGYNRGYWAPAYYGYGPQCVKRCFRNWNGGVTCARRCN